MPHPAAHQRGIAVVGSRRPAADMARKRKLRVKPNVLIAGTPGTGKTTTARMLAEASGGTAAIFFTVLHVCRS